MTDSVSEYTRWRACVTDAALSDELRAVENDPAAIEDRFYRELAFGTGGLRGVLGAGTNRMNIHIVARTTAGICRYLRESGAPLSAAISYDSRRNSRLFAEIAAGVFAKNGVTANLFPRLMPTPCLSFAVRHLGCGIGVMITASHNPAEYNGYKVYGADGCQITDEAAAQITAAIAQEDYFAAFPVPSLAEAKTGGYVKDIGSDVTEAYFAALDRASVYAGGDRSMPIVYTPLNGTGINTVPPTLRRHGFTNLVIPEAQREPNGEFPTCPKPNPELPEALGEALRCAGECGAELILATDPDADRVGVGVRSGNGYTLLNGNQTGVLLLDFLCTRRREAGISGAAPEVIKTVVTTPMADRIAAEYGCTVCSVLTGFKYIGEEIGRLEQRGESDRFLFGFEESCGGLTMPSVRDKDATNFALLLAELFVFWRERGKTLPEALEGLYARFGRYGERTLSYSFPGAVGFRRMGECMEELRRAPLTEIAARHVQHITDYLHDDTGLPRSNVLQYALEGDALVTVRPSGTEPKLKLYLSVRTEAGDSCEPALDALESAMGTYLK